MKRAEIKRAKAGREVQRVLAESVFNGEYTGLSVMEGLLREVQRTYVIVTWLGTQLDEMRTDNPEAFTTLLTKEVEEGTKPMDLRSRSVSAQVMRRQLVRTESGMNPLLVWFLREREHYIRCCGLALQMGIKFEQVEIAKKQGQMLYEAMQAFAVELGADLSNPDTVDRITHALEFAMGQEKIPFNDIDPPWATD
jgi:hypothetical protein